MPDGDCRGGQLDPFPRWRYNYLSFSDQQSARANRRLDVAYGADNVFAWFLPGKRGDHDIKLGTNYLWSSLRVQDFGNLNGTFTINSDLPFNASNPRTYPERLSVRVAGPVDFTMKGHFIGLFALFGVVGQLIERIGRNRAISAGLLLLAASSIALLGAADSVPLTALVLFGVGLGWNL